MLVMANETTAARWAARVAGWRASGLTAREYCEGREFNAGGLHHWASVLKRRAPTSTTVTAIAEHPMQWVALRAQRAERAPAPPTSSGALAGPSTSAPLTVELGAARVAIPSGFDGATLRVVLETLAHALRDGAR